MAHICSCPSCMPQPSVLSLERWRELMLCSVAPWHFWQLAGQKLYPIAHQNSSLVFEHSWQSGKSAGRREVLDAIKTAESMIERYIHRPIGRRQGCATIQFGCNSVFDLGYRNVHALGKYIYTPVGEVVLDLKDIDGDGIAEVAGGIFEGDLKQGEEYVVFAPASEQVDPLRNWLDYEIRPVKWSRGRGDTMQFAFSSWLGVRQSRVMDVVTNGNKPGCSVYIPIDDRSSYYSTVMIYRKWLDHRQVGNGMWIESDDCRDIGCWQARQAEFCLLNPASGLVRINNRHWHQYQGAQINFIHGDCPDEWELAISRLAAALLARCVCDCGDNCYNYWMEDLAKIPRNDVEAQRRERTYRRRNWRDILDNPFGSLRGAVWAWSWILAAMEDSYQASI